MLKPIFSGVFLTFVVMKRWGWEGGGGCRRFFMFPFLKILVHCLQSRVKVIGNKGEDISKMGTTSKEKNIFSQKM